MFTIPSDIVSIKIITEAVSIPRTLNNKIDQVLVNFEGPGKINLVDYMEKNFKFNLPIEKFGYLAGRSITTVKRDFKKAFSITPQRWLTKKATVAGLLSANGKDSVFV